jgi:hypothetical protein
MSNLIAESPESYIPKHGYHSITETGDAHDFRIKPARSKLLVVPSHNDPRRLFRRLITKTTIHRMATIYLLRGRP